MYFWRLFGLFQLLCQFLLFCIDPCTFPLYFIPLNLIPFPLFFLFLKLFPLFFLRQHSFPLFLFPCQFFLMFFLLLLLFQFFQPGLLFYFGQINHNFVLLWGEVFRLHWRGGKSIRFGLFLRFELGGPLSTFLFRQLFPFPFLRHSVTGQLLRSGFADDRRYFCFGDWHRQLHHQLGRLVLFYFIFQFIHTAFQSFFSVLELHF